MVKLAFALLLVGCAHAPVVISNGRPVPARIVDPKPDAVIVDVRPSIVWQLAPGTDGAHIEICLDKVCENVVTSYDANGTHGAPSADLQSGVYYVRASGLRNHATGLAGPSQKMIVEARAEVHSARFDIEGPREARESLDELLVLAPKIVDWVCDYLAIAKPTRKIRIALYATEAGYDVASRQRAEGQPSGRSRGFSKSGFAYVWYVGAAHRHPTDGPGQLERIVAHELVHVVQTLANEKYWRQPIWLLEAMPDVLANDALDAVYALPAGTSAGFFQVHAAAKNAVQRLHFVPVPVLLETDSALWRTKLHDTQSLFYSEGYSLLASLPTDKRHELVRGVARMDSDVERNARGLLHRIGSDAELDLKLRGWLEAAKPKTFTFVAADVRVLRDGLQVQSGVRSTASARTIDSFETARVEGDFELVKGGDSYRILFGSPKDGEYALRIDPNSSMTLLQVRGYGDRKLERADATVANGVHHVAVTWFGTTVVVEIDGTERMRVTCDARVHGSAGFSVKDGTLIVRNWTTTTIGSLPPMAEPTRSTSASPTP